MTFHNEIVAMTESRSFKLFKRQICVQASVLSSVPDDLAIWSDMVGVSTHWKPQKKDHRPFAQEATMEEGRKKVGGKVLGLLEN